MKKFLAFIKKTMYTHFKEYWYIIILCLLGACILGTCVGVSVGALISLMGN